MSFALVSAWAAPVASIRYPAKEADSGWSCPPVASNSQSVEDLVLVVEDDPYDTKLILRAIEKARRRTPIASGIHCRC